MLFIAEIGMNHNGNLDLCAELIRQAKWSGARYCKNSTWMESRRR